MAGRVRSMRRAAQAAAGAAERDRRVGAALAAVALRVGGAPAAGASPAGAAAASVAGGGRAAGPVRPAAYSGIGGLLAGLRADGLSLHRVASLVGVEPAVLRRLVAEDAGAGARPGPVGGGR